MSIGNRAAPPGLLLLHIRADHAELLPTPLVIAVLAAAALGLRVSVARAPSP